MFSCMVGVEYMVSVETLLSLECRFRLKCMFCVECKIITLFRFSVYVFLVQSVYIECIVSV